MSDFQSPPRFNTSPPSSSSSSSSGNTCSDMRRSPRLAQQQQQPSSSTPPRASSSRSRGQHLRRIQDDAASATWRTTTPADSYSLRGGLTGSRPSNRRIRAVNSRSSSRRREASSQHQRNASQPQPSLLTSTQEDEVSLSARRVCSDGPFGSGGPLDKNTGFEGRYRTILGELSLDQADWQAKEVRDRKLKEEQQEEQQGHQEQSFAPQDMRSSSPPRSPTPSLDQSGTTADDSVLTRTPEERNNTVLSSLPETPAKLRRPGSSYGVDQGEARSRKASPDENFDSPRAQRERREKEGQAHSTQGSVEASPSSKVHSLGTLPSGDDEVEQYLASKAASSNTGDGGDDELRQLLGPA